jgi:DNA processing protein
MTNPTACSECLRRSWLLSLAAPYIERTQVSSRGPDRLALLGLSNEDLAAAVAPKHAQSMLAQVEAMGAKHFADKLSGAQCWAVCRHDDSYPATLREIGAAPWALIARGDSALLTDIAWAQSVSIVGARRATSYGREVARSLGHELAAGGAAVISGMAFGIDACAHRGAIEGGRTVAVLGCGPDIAYPASHRPLWRRIMESGLVISELPPGTGAWRWTFPARNRIIAGISGMTVVVEAAKPSGSLVTADFAADFGRGLGAVPGPVTSRNSAGVNDLLAGGARMVREAKDVVDAMSGGESSEEGTSPTAA